MHHRSLAAAYVAAGLEIALASMAVPEPAGAGPSPRRFENPTVVNFQPATRDFFSFVLATGDFNGDGVDDLATSVPLDDGTLQNPLENAGAVAIRYGRLGDGLSAEIDLPAFLVQTRDHEPAEKGDEFGSALAACDFNGDGFDDLVVGVPLEDYRGHDDAGAIQIYYGVEDGLPGVADDFITQSTPGVPGDVEGGDGFGAALACGDFDRDGFDDLAVGSPGEDLHDLAFPDYDVGLVTIIPGTPLGFLEREAIDFTFEELSGFSETWIYFGNSLAAGDFNGDGFSDLVIGTPSVDRSGVENVGCISYVFGSDLGLTVAGSESLFEADSPGGKSERRDRFGISFAVGDFDADRFDDLAISIPREDLEENAADVDAGKVLIQYGSALGPSLAFHEFFDQSKVLGAGAPSPNERFGAGIAAGDFDGDGFDDLAVGSPGEFLTGFDDGQVTVWAGSPVRGLTAARNFVIAAGQPGIPPFPSAASAELGTAIAAGDFDGDGIDDLVIGAPLDDGDLPDIGSQLEVYGPLFAEGLTGDPLE